MSKKIIIGFLIFLISIILVSVRFDIPYQLNFDSLIKKMNFDGFELKSSILAFILILFISFIFGLIPLKKLSYLNKFSILFLIINILFFTLSIFAFIDSTIVYSKVSCEFKNF